MKSVWRYETTLAALVAVVWTTLGQCPEDSLAAIDPQTYRSPSGTYALFVDPKDRYGSQSASYRFTMNGEETWSCEKPYTLREVVVTDDGISAGWAYRTGPKGTSAAPRYLRHGKTLNPPRYLHIVILDSTGQELLNDTVERVRRAGALLPESLQPYVKQFLVDPANDRLMVYVREKDPNWWVYTLSTGGLVGRFNLEDRKMAYGFRKRLLVDARLLPGSPFVLLHWRGKGPQGWGARFSLLDAEYATIWSLDAENDYADMQSWPKGMSAYFRDNPAILSVDPPGRFAIRLFSENKRVSFAFAPVGGPHCIVSEVERADYVEPLLEPPNRVAAPERPLKYLGEVVLETAVEDESSFGTIRDFTFGNDGSIYAWRRADDNNTLLKVDQNTGRILSTRPFPNVKERLGLYWTDMPRIGANSFVIMRSTEKDTRDNVLALFDAESGEETPMGALLEEGGYANGLSRFADGGFVLLDTYRERHTPVHRLTVYDSQGSVTWQLRRNDPRYAEILGRFVRDVAVTSDERIALLATKAIHLMSRDGEYLRRCDLRELPGGGVPSFVREVVADMDGGFLVSTSANPPVVVRMNAEGTLRSRYTPRLANGKTFDILPGVKVDPSGRLWTSDGKSFMRLTDDGVVDVFLGEEPAPDRLVRVAGFTADRHGRIYVVAEGSGAVHVFDPSGRLLHICEPAEADFDRTITYAFVAATDDGEVFVQRPYTPRSQKDEYVRFSATGERKGVASFEPRLNTRSDGGPVWLFQPETEYRCGFSKNELLIVDGDGTVICRIDRRPNGNWLPWKSLSLGIAADGMLAVLVPDYQDNQRAYAVDLFTATGDPVRTIGLPQPADRFSGLAYGGGRVVVAGNREVVIVDLDGDRTNRWSLVEPGGADGPWRAYIIGEGRELLLFDRQAQRIHRYELP